MRILSLLLLILLYGHDCFAQAHRFFPSTIEASEDTTYQSIVNYALLQGYDVPSSDQQAKQLLLVKQLKAAGVWARLDILYVFATDGDSDFATLNWKDPTAFQCTKVNSPDFTTNQGFKGNGSTSYINSNWNFQTNGINYTQNSACIGGYVFTAATTGSRLMGSMSSSSIAMHIASTNAQRLNSNQNIGSAYAFSGTGYHAFNRSGSSNVQLYSGAVRTADNNPSSTTVNNSTLVLGQHAGSFSNVEISIGFAGGSMTEQQHNAFNTIINNYISSL